MDFKGVKEARLWCPNFKIKWTKLPPREGKDHQSLQGWVNNSHLNIFFKFSNPRECSVLVSTDVAAMGLDVKDLNLSINIGNFEPSGDGSTCLLPAMPKMQWKEDLKKDILKLTLLSLIQ